MKSTPTWRERLDAMYANLATQFREAHRAHPVGALYLYVKPATATEWGRFEIAPTCPDGFELVTAERINAIPFDALASRLMPILRRLPLIAQNEP